MRKRSSQTHGPGGWPARVSVAVQYGGAHGDGSRSLNGPNRSLSQAPLILILLFAKLSQKYPQGPNHISANEHWKSENVLKMWEKHLKALGIFSNDLNFVCSSSVIILWVMGEAKGLSDAQRPLLVQAGGFILLCPFLHFIGFPFIIFSF